MSANYPKGQAENVFKLIGGKVKENNFANSCAIRISRSLNYSGDPVEYIPPNLTVSGGDDKWYIYRVKELIAYLKRKYGEPDLYVKGQSYEDKFRGKKGIIVFEVEAWSDASGHATLWNGAACSDQCYFQLAKGVMLWELK